jgi:hypothetical protein
MRDRLIRNLEYEMENVVAFNQPSDPVQNGTALVTPIVALFVDRYRGFLRTTAESILGLARTLIDAEANLDDVELSIFLDQVGVHQDSSTYRKLKSIGENVPRLNPFVERLPNTWTTIYKLSRMEVNDFARVSENLTPFITAKQIDELIGVNRKKNGQSTDLSLDVSGLNTSQKSELYNELKKLRESFMFKMAAAPSLVKELKALEQSKAA